MTTAETLAGLCRAWLNGEDCGPALHDALEEAGWPLRWYAWNQEIADLRLPGVPLDYALVSCYRWANGTKSGWRWLLQCRGGSFHKGPHEPTEAAGRKAAEAALRRALRGGEVTP